GKAASAIFFGPADSEQVGGTQRSDTLLDGVAAFHATRDRGDAFRRHHRLECIADLGAQLLLFRREIEIHAQLSVPSRTGILLTPGTMVARILSTSPTSWSSGYRPSNTSKNTRASRRASWAPTHECSPQPNAMWGLG